MEIRSYSSQPFAAEVLLEECQSYASLGKRLAPQKEEAAHPSGMYRLVAISAGVSIRHPALVPGKRRWRHRLFS